MPVRTKRISEPPSHADGYRVLIDRIWPRGISRHRAVIDLWSGVVRVVFAARDAEHSNATVLAEVLRRGLP